MRQARKVRVRVPIDSATIRIKFRSILFFAWYIVAHPSPRRACRKIQFHVYAFYSLFSLGPIDATHRRGPMRLHSFCLVASPIPPLSRAKRNKINRRSMKCTRLPRRGEGFYTLLTVRVVKVKKTPLMKDGRTRSHDTGFQREAKRLFFLYLKAILRQLHYIRDQCSHG